MATEVTLLLKGDAALDAAAGVTGNTAGGIALKAALGGAGSIPLAPTMGTLGGSGNHSVDSWIIPQNPASNAWPDWKETPMPLRYGAINPDFGTWNASKSKFTFNKEGLYLFSASLHGLMMAGSNRNYDRGTNIRFTLEIEGPKAMRMDVGGCQFGNTNPGDIRGEMANFAIPLELPANSTATLIVMANRNGSSANDDMVALGVVGFGTADGNFYSIARIR